MFDQVNAAFCEGALMYFFSAQYCCTSRRLCCLYWVNTLCLHLWQNGFNGARTSAALDSKSNSSFLPFFLSYAFKIYLLYFCNIWHLCLLHQPHRVPPLQNKSLPLWPAAQLLPRLPHPHCCPLPLHHTALLCPAWHLSCPLLAYLPSAGERDAYLYLFFVLHCSIPQKC